MLRTLVNKDTLRSLQAFGDAFKDDAVTPEGQQWGVGRVGGTQEVGLSAMGDIITWLGEKKEREKMRERAYESIPAGL